MSARDMQCDEIQRKARRIEYSIRQTLRPSFIQSQVLTVALHPTPCVKVRSSIFEQLEIASNKVW